MIENLTAFDVAVLGVILLSMVFAFAKGFVTVALSLAAWAGAYFVATSGFAIVAPYGRDLISPPELADILVFVGLFFVALFVFKTGAEWIGRTIKTSAVGFLDRSLGALFGMVRGIVIVSVTFLAFTKLYDRDTEPDWVAEAKLRPLVAWSADMLEYLGARLVGAETSKKGVSFIEIAQDTVKSQFIEEGLEDVARDYIEREQQQLDALIDAVAKDAETEDNPSESETE